MEKFDRLFKYSRTQECKKRVASIQGSIRPITIFIFLPRQEGIPRLLRRYPEHAFNGSTGIPDQFSFPLGRGKISTTEAKRKDRVGNGGRTFEEESMGGEKEMDDLCRVFLLEGSACDGVTRFRFDLTDV